MFSCRGIQLAVDWFLEKGHKDITVFVPAWRKEQSRPDAPITGTNNTGTDTCVTAKMQNFFKLNHFSWFYRHRLAVVLYYLT